MSSNEQLQFVSPELQVGKKLTDARRKRRLRLNTVARELNIKESYLKALEEDDYASIPGRAYALGFLRSYAERLDLDADKLVKEVQESGVLVGDPFYDMPVPAEEGGLPTRQVMLLALAALVIVGLSVKGLQMYQDRVPAEEVAVNEVAPVQPVAEVIEEQEPAPVQVAKAPESKGDVVVKAAEKIPAPKVEEKPVEVVAPKVEEKPIEVAKAEPEKVEPVKVEPQIPEQPAGARILLQAQGNDVWLQIRRPSNGRILVSRTLKDGEAYWVRNWSDIVLDTGRPQSLMVSIDGAEQGYSNTSGGVVRGLKLEADYLKNDYFANKLHTKPLPEEVKSEPKAEEQATTPVAETKPAEAQPVAAETAPTVEAKPTEEKTEAPVEAEAKAEPEKVNPLALPPIQW